MPGIVVCFVHSEKLQQIPQPPLLLEDSGECLRSPQDIGNAAERPPIACQRKVQRA